VDDNVIRLEMAHHPQEILDTMRQMVPAVRRLDARQRWKRRGAVALLIAGIALFFGSMLLGILVTPLIAALGPVLVGGSFCSAALGFALVVASFLLFAFAGGKPWYVREHFNDVYRVLYTLRDDTGRKGRVVGWLDLSGPYRKEKLVRSARSLSGKRKEYYSDPWFQAKIKLVDGNLLRITLKDKVKTKARSVAGYYTQLSAKLVPNPSLYRLKTVRESDLPMPAVVAHQDGICIVKSEIKVQGPGRGKAQPALPIGEFLETLKEIYAHLEPLEPTATVSDSPAN